MVEQSEKIKGHSARFGFDRLACASNLTRDDVGIDDFGATLL
jgi:hypothetical protein